MPDATSLPVHHALILVSWGLVIALVARAARERKVGAAVVALRGASSLRPVLLALCSGLALVVTRVPDFPLVPAIAALGISAALALLSPAASDRLIGESGVGYGWTACGYEEVESWELSRDGLRFRFGGVWREIAVPPDKRMRVHRILSQHAGGRENLR